VGEIRRSCILPAILMACRAFLVLEYQPALGNVAALEEIGLGKQECDEV
jgi:hypothetical protein